MPASLFGRSSLSAQIVLCAALAGCQTYDQSVRQSLQPYMHKPVRYFSEQQALAPTAVYDNADGSRTYIFNKWRCGYTIKATGEPGQPYMVREIISTCPPG